MGKHTRFAPVAKSDGNGHDGNNLYDEVGNEVAATLAYLRRLKKMVDDTAASGDATPAIIREGAAVARAICTLSTEVRQREKHVRLQIERLTPEEKRLSIRQMIIDASPDERELYRGFIDEAQSEERILA